MNQSCHSGNRCFSVLGDAYYGEYPVAFAACFGNEEIYDYLILHGADPNLQDSFGNTVLHMVVIADQLVRASLFARLFPRGIAYSQDYLLVTLFNKEIRNGPLASD